MVRTSRLRLPLALLGFVVCGGCGAPASPPVPGSGVRAEDSVRSLEAASVAPIRVSFDDRTSAVRTLRGRFPTSRGDREVVARDFLERHAARFGLTPDLAELAAGRRVSSLGGVSVTFAQRYRGLEVFAGGVLVAFDLHADIIHVRNATVPGLGPGLEVDLDDTPRVGAGEGLRRAGEYLGLWLGPSTSTPPPRLLVVRGGKGYPGAHLAWRVEARTPSPRPGEWYVFVSAHSGRVVRAFDRLKRGGAPCAVCTPTSDPDCGLVLFENPVDGLNDPYLADSANVDVAQTGCLLSNLTSTNRLDGLWANTSLSVPRVAPPYDTLRSAGPRALDEVNAYFHVNRAKEYLNSLGHSGVMSYSITIDAHDGSLGDNSHYSPGNRELHFGEGGVDDAQDADVVYHEYGHAIQDDQVPGFGMSAEGGATGEGFGDYFAAAITEGSACAPELGPACVASWDAVSFNPYDGSLGSGCLRRTDGLKQYPADFVWEVHDDGEMWSAALWSLRTQLGGPTLDALVIQSHTYLTASAGFIDAADGLLSADVALYAGAHAGAIHDAMRARGIPRTGTPASTTNMGDWVAYSCSTGHSYANGEYRQCSYTVPGADRVRFRFSTFNTESGWDFVYISDPDYLQVERLSGNLGGNVLSAAVEGDTIVARFKADTSVQRYGFDIDRVYHSAPNCVVDGDCDDSNPCTDDTCDAAAGDCLHLNNVEPCTDSNVCTTGDRCAGGFCAGGPPLPCDDTNPCNGVETCHPVAGCQPGVAPSCGDGDPCTFDSCHPVTGCTHQPICGDAGVPDGGVPPPDGATPPPDGWVPPDGATPPPDGWVPPPDGWVPPDGVVSPPDGWVPPPDGLQPGSISPRPGCSCSQPGGGSGPGVLLVLALGLLVGWRRRRAR